MIGTERNNSWRTGGKALLACLIVASVLVSQLALRPATAFAEAGMPSLQAQSVTRFRVYFPLCLASGAYVYPVEYFVPHTDSPAKAAVEALIAGLPDAGGFMFVKIPKVTKVLSLTIKEKICTVDFSEELRQVNIGSGGEAALVSAIVYTLAQFPAVDKVSILIGGKPAETVAGHVDITKPLEPSGKIYHGFPDSVQHWAGGAIMALQSMDILGGFEDGTFRPDRQLSRAEFVKMLSEALELPEAPKQEIPFTDLAGHWSRPYVQKALAAGVISASHYGSAFGPDGAIPREEMAYLLVPGRDSYAATHPGVQYPAPSVVPVFVDAKEIGARYVENVNRCVAFGLLQGYPGGKFGPKRGLTRGEAATVLARMMGMRGAGSMVVVSSPKPGFKWDDGQFVVLGAASAFEGTVDFRFLGANREIFYRDYTTSTLGMGWGAVGISVDTSLFRGKPTLLEVFMVSMKDGSDFAVTGVPIEHK